jgi:hypothetical protein
MLAGEFPLLSIIAAGMTGEFPYVTEPKRMSRLAALESRRFYS